MSIINNNKEEFVKLQVDIDILLGVKIQNGIFQLLIKDLWSMYALILIAISIVITVTYVLCKLIEQ